MPFRRARGLQCSRHAGVNPLLLLLGLGATLLSAHAQQFSFSSYGVSSGLSNLNAMTMLQDHTGVVWAGTQSGIFTADGLTFQKEQKFTDAGLELIRGLREDSAGRVWAADGHHLAYLEQGQVHSIPGLNLNVLSHEPLDYVFLKNQPNTLYLLRAEELLLVSSSDFGRNWNHAPAFTAAQLTAHPRLRSISAVTAANGSILWLACGHSLCAFDTRTRSVTIYGQSQGVPVDHWQALLFTRSGALWARGEKSLITLPPGSPAFRTLHAMPASYHEDVRWPLLAEDPQGRILLNLSSGFAILSKDQWSVLNARNGLPDDEIEAMLFDRSGALWLTCAGHGVLLWHGYGDWEGWTKADGLSSNITWSIATSPTTHARKTYWITTDKGLDQLDPASHHLDRALVHDGRLFGVVVDHRNHVWTTDRTGTIYEYDPRTASTRIAANNLDRVFQLYIDRNRNIWACSRKGLLFFSADDQWRQPRFVQQSSLNNTYVWSIAEGTSGSLWVATGKGLFRLQGDTWRHITLPSSAEAPGRNFMMVVSDDDTLWVQSRQPYPILHLRVDGQQASILDRVSSDILLSDNITFVERDHRGWIWVGTDDGVYAFNGMKWIRCSAEDGLLWDDTDFHAFLADDDGSVWIGTSAGVSHLLHPEHLFRDATPAIRLTGLALGGQMISAQNSNFNLRKPTLSFHFLNTNYDRGSAIRGMYKLDGVDNDWQETDGRLIRFPALAAGPYTLRVRSRDDRLLKDSPTLTFSFVILEPWWKRSWFLALEGLAAVFCIIALWRLSVHILVARQTELQRLVAARTAELENEKRELLTARTSLLEAMRHDSLTGLLNRGAVFENLGRLCEEARQNQIPLAVVMADLDCFKRINDQYGHLTGDKVLIESATRIKSVTRSIDAVGRYGGEELLILMPGLSPGSLQVRMEQIRSAVADTPIIHQHMTLYVTCSFGVAWYNGDTCTTESLLSLADAALYLAKQNGRNRVEYAELVEA